MPLTLMILDQDVAAEGCHHTAGLSGRVRVAGLGSICHEGFQAGLGRSR